MRWQDFRMDFLKPAKVGRFEVAKFVIPAQLNHHDLAGRPTGYGEFTRIVEGDEIIWMGDTRAEIEDHFEFFAEIETGSRVVITGLGLGMAAAGAMKLGASLVHVIDLNEDVIQLIGSQLEPMAEALGVEFKIFHDDARTWVPPEGQYYDLAWHDIWPHITDENLPEMAAMREHFDPYVEYWQGCWAEDNCLRMERVMRHIHAGRPADELSDEDYEFAWRSAMAIMFTEATGR